MTTTYNDRQAGSLVTFILVAVVLVALAAGGIYLAKQRGIFAANQDTGNSEIARESGEGIEGSNQQEQTENDQQDQLADQNQQQPSEPEQDKSNEDNQQQTEQGSVAGNSTDGNSSSSNGGAQTPAAPSPAPAPQQQDQPEASPAPAVAPRTGGQTATTIPATGFEDQIMVSTIGVTALVYGTVQYVQSRRRLSKL